MGKTQKGFSAVEGLLVLIVGLMLGFVAWRVWLTTQDTAKNTSDAAVMKLKVIQPAKKVCQLTGDTDREYHPPQPTLNRTATRYGLTGTDNGVSFEFNNKIWFLFGDSSPAAGIQNLPSNNDSMAYSTDTSVNGCSSLNFVVNNRGSYANPTVSTTPSEKPVTLRTNEVPEAGIADGGNAYAVFSTDNTASNPHGLPARPDGGGNRSVVGIAENIEQAQFRYLYDLSTSKFTNVSLADGNDDYIYFWGSDIAGSSYRHSSVYVARKFVGKMNSPNGLQYFSSLTKTGSPVFSGDESRAAALIHDSPSDCTGELSVQWNTPLKRWLMLYNCADSTHSNPRGIYARVAAQPWGPWSNPITIFATQDGLCSFIHRSTSSAGPCDSLSAPARLTIQGGDYAPYIINRLTTGSSASSTIYFTMSTWNPYQVVLMKATIGLAQ